MSQQEPNLIDPLHALRQVLIEQFNAAMNQATAHVTILRNLGQAIAAVDQQIQRVLADHQAKLKETKTIPK